MKLSEIQAVHNPSNVTGEGFACDVHRSNTARPPHEPKKYDTFCARPAVVRFEERDGWIDGTYLCEKHTDQAAERFPELYQA